MASRVIIEAAQPSLDHNGNLISGAKLQFFDADTLEAKAVYSDNTLSTSLGSEIVSDGYGMFPDMWAANNSAFRVVWKDSDDVVLKTFNRIVVNSGLEGVSDYGATLIQSTDADNAKLNLQIQYFKGAIGTPTTSNPHWQSSANSQLGFYFGTSNLVACIGGKGTVYFNPASTDFYPNGTDKRFSISDTSLQLHYDNIALGVGDGSVKPPNFTWKLPDSSGGGLGDNGGGNWPLASLTANHDTFNIAVGHGAPAGVKTALPLKIYTDNNVYATTERLKVTGGAAQGQIIISSADLLLGSNGITFSGATLDLVTGIKMALGGRSISLSNGTGSQALYTYAASNTVHAGIGTDSSAGGVRIFGANGGASTSHWLFQLDGVLRPYANNTYDIGTSALNARRVYTTYVYSGSNQVLGARDTGWTADTGTAKKTANATYSGTAEATYTQATIQALMNAVRDATQTQKSIKDALIAHGMIGA